MSLPRCRRDYIGGYTESQPRAQHHWQSEVQEKAVNSSRPLEMGLPRREHRTRRQRIIGREGLVCDRCGTPLASGAQFCTSCGKAIAPGAVPPATPAVTSPPQGRVRKHIHLLATLWLVNGVLRLMGVAWLMLFGGTFFPWLRGRIGPDAWPLGPGWGLDSLLSGGFFSLGIFLGFFGVLHLGTGVGTFRAAILGAHSGPRAGNLSAAAVPLWHGPGNLYALGACSRTVRARIRPPLSFGRGNP